MDNQIAIQYREILERFNKIIWTHKIHLCQADIYLAKRKKRNLILSILSALVSASAITNIARNSDCSINSLFITGINFFYD